MYNGSEALRRQLATDIPIFVSFIWVISIFVTLSKTAGYLEREHNTNRKLSSSEMVGAEILMSAQTKHTNRKEFTRDSVRSFLEFITLYFDRTQSKIL